MCESKKEQPPKPHEQPTGTKEEPSAQPPIVEKRDPIENQRTPARSDTKNDAPSNFRPRARERHLHRSQSVSNGLIAVFTGLLVLLTWWQERAAVSILPITMTDFVENAKPRIGIAVANKGVSPAYNASFIGYCGKGNATTREPDLKNAERLASSVKTNLTIFRDVSNMTTSCTLATPLGASDVESIKDGNKERMFVWGSVSYDTIFIPRYTNFCFYFGGPSSLNWNVQATFQACAFHNDAN